MKLDIIHIDFENHCKRIIGLKLSSVDYYEVKYNPENPTPWYKTKYPEIDSVDFSIVLHFDSDRVEIFWDGQFYQYGIGLSINDKSVFDGFQTWNVSDSEIWCNVIGEKIVDLNIAWDIVRTTEPKTGKTEERIYPQDLTLIFSNGEKIFISAAGFPNSDDNEVQGLLDNLTVSNNENIARQVKMIN
jgi:hypothetical protein